MPIATVTALPIPRQEDLAWRDAAGVADYLAAHLKGDSDTKDAVLADAKELARRGQPDLKDELDALRTRRYADAA